MSWLSEWKYLVWAGPRAVAATTTTTTAATTAAAAAAASLLRIPLNYGSSK